MIGASPLLAPRSLSTTAPGSLARLWPLALGTCGPSQSRLSAQGKKVDIVDNIDDSRAQTLSYHGVTTPVTTLYQSTGTGRGAVGGVMALPCLSRGER